MTTKCAARQNDNSTNILLVTFKWALTLRTFVTQSSVKMAQCCKSELVYKTLVPLK